MSNTITALPQAKYKISASGTAFHSSTLPTTRAVLDHLIHNTNTRIKLDYGNVITGISWGEKYDITGTLKRSSGPLKVPILIHNARSGGGGAILDHCIIAITHANKKNGGTIYRLPITKLN